MSVCPPSPLQPNPKSTVSKQSRTSNFYELEVDLVLKAYLMMASGWGERTQVRIFFNSTGSLSPQQTFVLSIQWIQIQWVH